MVQLIPEWLNVALLLQEVEPMDLDAFAAVLNLYCLCLLQDAKHSHIGSGVLSPLSTSYAKAAPQSM